MQAAAPKLIATESAELRRDGVDLVVTDVAALPCAAAAAAGIPAVILSNFTWDWIYEGFLEEEVASPLFEFALPSTLEGVPRLDFR